MAATCIALVVIIILLSGLLIVEKIKNARMRKSAQASHIHIMPNGNHSKAVNQNTVVVPQSDYDHFMEENDMYGKFQ